MVSIVATLIVSAESFAKKTRSSISVRSCMLLDSESGLAFWLRGACRKISVKEAQCNHE